MSTTPDPTPGDVVIFRYSGDPTDAPTYMAVDGHEGTITRPLTADEADIEDVGRMFRVSFGAGNEIDAFADELTIVRSSTAAGPTHVPYEATTMWCEYHGIRHAKDAHAKMRRGEDWR